MFSFGRLGFNGGGTSMDWYSNHTFRLVISLKNDTLPKIKKIILLFVDKFIFPCYKNFEGERHENS
jgi:hypothetical protein